MFWHLNPRTLEPWRIKKEIEDKQHYEDLDFLAWRIGHYNAIGIATCFSRNISYPERPDGLQESEGKGEVMTDGARFAAFAAAHRRAIAQRKQKPQG